ncbi:hypothetical protein HanRHA438_Chr11g0488631 [Helianthus annuus]|nr:hypothetical protein HanRHA438_Chr11g0488631 [Helianthus annuus]
MVHQLRYAMRHTSDKLKHAATYGVHQLRHTVRIEQAPLDNHKRVTARGVHKLHQQDTRTTLASLTFNHQQSKLQTKTYSLSLSSWVFLGVPRVLTRR